MATPKNTVIHEVTNRETGTLIKIIQLGKPIGDDKWAADCEHGARTTVKTRRAAHEAGRTPTAWCTTCKKGTTKVVKVNGTKVAETRKINMPAPAKRAAAKKTAVKA